MKTLTKVNNSAVIRPLQRLPGTRECPGCLQRQPVIVATHKGKDVAVCSGCLTVLPDESLTIKPLPGQEVTQTRPGPVEETR